MARLFRQPKLTAATKRALQGAEEEARRLQHGYIGTEHLLLGLLRREDGVTAQLLTGLGVELGKVRSAVELVIGRGEQPATGTMHLTPRTKKVLALAAEEAQRLGRDAVDTPHLLLGLVREGRGVASGVLESLGAKLDTLRAAVETLPEDAEGEQREEQEDDSDAGGTPWWEQARLRTRVEQSLRKFFSGPRDNVLSIRVDNSDVAAIDALVEAGVLKTRSEAAAWLIKSGIAANRSLFEQVQAKTVEIRRLRQEAQELIHCHVAGAAAESGEGE